MSSVQTHPCHPILQRILTCILTCRQKAALLRTRITHLKILDRCHDIFEEPNKVKTQIQPPPFHCGTPPKCPPTVRPDRKKQGTLNPASLSRSTEGVPPIIKVPRELFLCRNALLPTTPFDDRLAISGLPALPWRLCRIKYPLCSGANPPGLCQIVEGIKEYERKTGGLVELVRPACYVYGTSRPRITASLAERK
jgi:hypothetical protein